MTRFACCSFRDRSRAVVGAYLAGGEEGDHFLSKLLAPEELMEISEDAVKVVEYALATEKGRASVKDFLEAKFQVIEAKVRIFTGCYRRRNGQVLL